MSRLGEGTPSGGADTRAQAAGRADGRAAGIRHPSHRAREGGSGQPPHWASIACLSAAVTGRSYFCDTWAKRTA